MNTRTQSVFKWGVLIYLAILPMAGTTALRNLILLLLLLLLLGRFIRDGHRVINATSVWRGTPLSLWLWAAFLLLFPLWAVESDVAWSNLKGQWGESLAAWSVGLGTIFMLGRRGPSLSELACASFFLIGVHLLLTLMAWAGLFGTLTILYMSWGELALALKKNIFFGPSMNWHWQDFPWGFRGFDPMHGNLGYAASQTVALLIAAAFADWRAHHFNRVLLAILGGGACLLSLAIASSRGAMLYTLLLLVLAGVLYLTRCRVSKTDVSHAVVIMRRPFWGGMIVILAVGIALFQVVRHDARWSTTFDKIRAGFLIEDPVKLLCDGLGPDEREYLLSQLGITDPVKAEQILGGLEADGGRIILMRVGLNLVRWQPLGLDGSRQAYKKMMDCGYGPAFDFAHAHQAWIDTALALGWGGAFLFAVLLGSFLVAGWRSLDRTSNAAWAFALVLLSSFWILRGFADSVYREHYLQMQALLLGYIFGQMKLMQKNTTAT